ncbi:MAG: PHP domain-containing protein [Anaerolineae bacterium]|nr:PHP domain-containing protein [Anaerolineae bacterium]
MNLTTLSKTTGVSWGKADLHLHTTYSDGYLSPPETIDFIAENTSVNVIAITDHDTTEGAFIARDYARRYHPDLEVIIGQEVTTGNGDVLGLFLHATLPKQATAAEAVNAIHQQGGLAIAPHPFVYGWEMESVGNAIRHLPFDGVEVRHGCPLSLPGNVWAGFVNRWLGQRLPRLGASDSHIPYTTGQAFTWFPGRTGADLRRAIEEDMVRPGGTMWKITSMLCTLPVLQERKPGYYHHPKQAPGSIN